MRVLALDPGGTTGVAQYDSETGKFTSTQESERNHLVNLVRVQAHGVDVVVCEDFRITMQTAKKSPQADALKIIGAVDWICWDVGIPFVLQTPGDAKRFATDDRLKKAGFWTPGRRHANDAARHLFLFMAKKGLLNAVEVDARES